MRTFLMIFMWLFFFFMVIVDVGFTYVHHETMNEWEMNPVQLIVLEKFGYQSCICLRLFTSFLVFLLAWLSVKHRLLITITSFVVSVLLGMAFLTYFLE